MRVRLCKEPDAVCLQGGCGYCSDGLAKDHRWWSIPALRRYAEQNAMLPDFVYGYENRWPNREKRGVT